MPRKVRLVLTCVECRAVKTIQARGRCAGCYKRAKAEGRLPPILRVPLPPCRRCGVPVAKHGYVYCADCRAVVLAAYRSHRVVPPLGTAPVERLAPVALPAPDPRKHRHDRATAAIWQQDPGAEAIDATACVVVLVGIDVYAEAIRRVAAAGWEE